MKIKPEYRLYLYFLLIYTFLISCIFLFISLREKSQRQEIFKSELLIYLHEIDTYIVKNHLNLEQMDQLNLLLPYLPDSLSLVIIGKTHIAFSNNAMLTEALNANRQLPEILQALHDGSGWATRTSPLYRTQYCYYTRYNGTYIIYLALPYNIPTTHTWIKSDNALLNFTIFLFLASFLFLYLIHSIYKKTTHQLTDFLLNLFHKKTDIPQILPSNNKSNRIDSLITDIYNESISNKNKFLQEREKLLEHFHFSSEGIAFFTSGFEKIYANTHFFQYLNHLINRPTFDVRSLFQSPVFSEVVDFINHHGKENVFNTKLYNAHQIFSARVVIFGDQSFEIVIQDISKEEKNNFDRIKMTDNIAHELRTPVASIQGYLETLMNYENMEPAKQQEFIRRTYRQSLRLSEIIQDVVLLQQLDLDNTSPLFPIEDVNIVQLIKEIIEIDHKEEIAQYNCVTEIQISDQVVVKGNKMLLRSIFYNLGMNVLKYAGDNVIVVIHNYHEDNDYYYFSFADNGVGVESKHLDFLFERFYRVAEGRTRDKGGSGLGLSIVKNAVNFHKGTILSKNRKGGGLEFLFTLRKQ